MAHPAGTFSFVISLKKILLRDLFKIFNNDKLLFQTNSYLNDVIDFIENDFGSLENSENSSQNKIHLVNNHCITVQEMTQEKLEAFFNDLKQSDNETQNLFFGLWERMKL